MSLKSNRFPLKLRVPSFARKRGEIRKNSTRRSGTSKAPVSRVFPRSDLIVANRRNYEYSLVRDAISRALSRERLSGDRKAGYARGSGCADRPRRANHRLVPLVLGVEPPYVDGGEPRVRGGTTRNVAVALVATSRPGNGETMGRGRGAQCSAALFRCRRSRRDPDVGNDYCATKESVFTRLRSPLTKQQLRGISFSTFLSHPRVVRTFFIIFRPLLTAGRYSNLYARSSFVSLLHACL